MKHRTKGGWEEERLEISGLRHQPSSYLPFCLLVLRPTRRIQTQSNSAAQRESRGLYREGCGGEGAGNLSKQLHSSLEGGSSSLKKRGMAVTLSRMLSTLTYVLSLNLKLYTNFWSNNMKKIYMMCIKNKVLGLQKSLLLHHKCEKKRFNNSKKWR